MNYNTYCFLSNYKDLAIWKRVYYNCNGSVRKKDYEVRQKDNYDCLVYVGSSLAEVLQEIEEMV